MSGSSPGEYLFVYGSLLTGTPNRRLNRQMRRLLRHSRPAMIQGRLYNLGHYPGAVASAAKTDRVYGRVMTLRNSSFLLQLDRYEHYLPDELANSEFIRILMPAQVLPSRIRLVCWVYVYNKDLSRKHRILSGDYVHFRRIRRK